MGKSNKFDYTHRGSVGKKLGDIIGTALERESEKVKKDAKRLSEKARKQSTGSAGDAAEASHTTHIIDLKAPGKQLGDEGVCALANGLEAALRNGSGSAWLVLEDINFSGNGITTASLARLAPIIELAKLDLKTLNLSDNRIKVDTDQEVAQWEIFLLAFQRCIRLRRLDLSGNSELGPRALEVFARLYVAERPIEPMAMTGDSSVLSLISEDGRDGANGTQGRQALTSDDFSGFSLSTINQRFLRRRCGLRSIPYLTLHHTGLNDAGALWLSHALEHHHYPAQLIDELNAAHADSAIKPYQQDTNSRGLDWSDNAALGKDGVHLLDKTEAVRRQTMIDAKDMLSNSATTADDDESLFGEEYPRRKSTERALSRALTGNRRASVRSIRTADGGEHEATEVESARKKIQRAIITEDLKDNRASSVDLWRSALKLYKISRTLLFVTPVTTRYHRDASMFMMADSPVAENGIKSQIGTTKLPAPAPAPALKSRPTYASKLAPRNLNTTSDTESVILDVTNTPNTPLQLQRPTHRKGAFSEGSDLAAVTAKLKVLIPPHHPAPGPQRYVQFQRRMLLNSTTADEKCFRRREGPLRLPGDIVERIVHLAMDAREMDLMSEKQRKTVISRGQDRDSLTVEREWLRMAESSQVWTLLDSIGCLAYEH